MYRESVVFNSSVKSIANYYEIGNSADVRDAIVEKLYCILTRHYSSIRKEKSNNAVSRK